MKMIELYTPGDIFTYIPTERAKIFGDTPGTIEIVSEDGRHFVAKIIEGICNHSKGKEEAQILVAHGSEFEKGLIHLPATVDSGLTFEDMLGE